MLDERDSKVNAKSSNTRAKIMDSAERLFAERGVDQTSVRQILSAAGQGNSSAIRYHFGCKEDLLTALLRRRLGILDQLRLRRLDTLGFSSDVRNLVKVLVLPLADQLDARAECQLSLGLVAQLLNHPRHDGLVSRLLADAPGLQRLERLLCARLKELPEALVRQRVALAHRQAFAALAEQQRHVSAQLNGLPTHTTLFVAQLIDSLAASLSAEPSRETMAELARPARRSA